MRKLYARFVLWLIRPALELDRPQVSYSYSLSLGDRVRVESSGAGDSSK